MLKIRMISGACSLAITLMTLVFVLGLALPGTLQL